MTTLDSKDGPQPVSLKSALLAILTSALWGGTPVAIRLSVSSLPPIAVSGYRFAIAAVFMFFWCRIEGVSLGLKKGEVKPSLIAGLLLFAQIGLFTMGVDQSNASHGTILINTFVFWVIAIEHWILRTHRLRAQQWVGLMMASTGALFVYLDAQHSAAGFQQGDILLLLSALVLAVKIVFTRHAIQSVQPSKLIFWHDVVGVACFFVASLAFETQPDSVSQAAIWGVLYQGCLVAGLCFAIQTHLLHKHAASQISVFSFSTPAFGLLAAIAILGEPVTSNLIVSIVLVALGIFIVNRS